MVTATSIKKGYKQTEVGEIPEDWETESFGKVFRKVNAKGHQVQATEYKIYGALPIIDQGQKSIVGFSDKIDKCFSPPEGGVVIFGDHTCIVKYVDFKFLVGADGVQILAANSGNSARYHYFDLQLHGVQPTGYNRHFKFLKERLYISPPLPEQTAIAAVLSDTEALIEKLEKLIAKKRNIKTATMQQLLTGKKRLAGFSGSWKETNLGSLGLFRGGTGFSLRYQGLKEGKYPFYKVSDMNNEGNTTFMINSNNWITEDIRKRAGANTFPPNTIVFAKVGAAVFLERKKILSRESCIDNNMMGFILNEKDVYPRFMHYLFLSMQLGRLVSTTALPSLNGKQIAELIYSIPELSEQTAIASVISDMDNEINELEARLNKTRELKKGMMQQLLTGNIRLV